MKTKIVLLTLILFSQLSFAMEVKDSVTPMEIDEILGIKTEVKVFDGQDKQFDQLPDEVILYIFSFFYGADKHDNKLLETLLNTFGGKEELINLRQVCNRFKRLAEDKYRFLLKAKNKETFQKEFFRICSTKKTSEQDLKQDLKILRCLLKAAIIDSEILDINAKYVNGNTPLKYAICIDSEIVKLILNYIGSAFDLNKQLEIVKAKSDDGYTCLLFAAFWSNLEVVKLILNYIERFTLDEQFEIISARNKYGVCSYYLARFTGNKKIEKLLGDRIWQFGWKRALRQVDVITAAKLALKSGPTEGGSSQPNSHCA